MDAVVAAAVPPIRAPSAHPLNECAGAGSLQVRSPIMTETYDPVSHLAVIALIVFYWLLLRIWHQPPPSDRDRDTRKPAAPQQLAAETDSQKGRSLRANARGTAISPAAQAK